MPGSASAERQRLGLKQEDASDICATAVQTMRRWEKATPMSADKLAVAPAADAIRDPTNAAVRQIEQFAEAQASKRRP